MENEPPPVIEILLTKLAGPENVDTPETFMLSTSKCPSISTSLLSTGPLNVAFPLTLRS